MLTFVRAEHLPPDEVSVEVVRGEAVAIGICECRIDVLAVGREADAQLLFTCFSLLFMPVVFDQITFPVSELRQNRWRMVPSSSAEVTKSWSPKITGAE
jgi:hypothetical protein